MESTNKVRFHHEFKQFWYSRHNACGNQARDQPSDIYTNFEMPQPLCLSWLLLKMLSCPAWYFYRSGSKQRLLCQYWFANIFPDWFASIFPVYCLESNGHGLFQTNLFLKPILKPLRVYELSKDPGWKNTEPHWKNGGMVKT